MPVTRNRFQQPHLLHDFPAGKIAIVESEIALECFGADPVTQHIPDADGSRGCRIIEGEIGKIFGDFVVDGKFAVEFKLRKRGSRKQFGIARDHEKGILIHGRFGFDVADTVSFLQDDLTILHDHHRETGQVPVSQAAFDIAVKAVGKTGLGPGWWREKEQKDQTEQCGAHEHRNLAGNIRINPVGGGQTIPRYHAPVLSIFFRFVAQYRFAARIQFCLDRGKFLYTVKGIKNSHPLPHGRWIYDQVIFINEPVLYKG